MIWGYIRFRNLHIFAVVWTHWLKRIASKTCVHSLSGHEPELGAHRRTKLDSLEICFSLYLIPSWKVCFNSGLSWVNCSLGSMGGILILKGLDYILYYDRPNPFKKKQWFPGPNIKCLKKAVGDKWFVVGFPLMKMIMMIIICCNRPTIFVKTYRIYMVI